MSAYAVVFRPEAETESVEACRWYDQRRSGLGSEFLRAVVEAIARIQENPRTFPRARGETRRAMLRRFPYAVYFRVTDSHIVILAVVHGRRHPRRWQFRR